MKELLIGILLIGMITGLIPVIGLLLIEKYKILFIMVLAFDLCWIGKEVYNWCMEV